MNYHSFLTNLQIKENINDQLVDDAGDIVSQEFANGTNYAAGGIVVDSSIHDVLKKEEFLKLPAQIFHPYRLLILVALWRWGSLDFTSLRDGIPLKSEGNLANHLRVLEDLELIRYRKEFVERRPKTFYELTDKGKEKFQDLMFYMRDFLKELQ